MLKYFWPQLNLNPDLSLRKVTEDKEVRQEIGQYEKIRVAVGYSRSLHGYFVRLADMDNHESILLTDRSDAGYLSYVQTQAFISALNRALDAKGLYLDGNEEELAQVVSNLTLQLMERIRNEP